MSGLEKQRLISVEDLAVRALGQAINALVGTTAIKITKPATAKQGILVLKCETDDFLVRIGDQIAKTFTAATSDIATATGHSYVTGDGPFHLTTSDTLPAGLALATDYFIIGIDANTFKFATSFVNAQSGTAVDVTDTGTGTHTIAGMPAAVQPAASVVTGLEAWHLKAGDELVLAGPEKVTAIGFGATPAVLRYFWL